MAPRAVPNCDRQLHGHFSRFIAATYLPHFILLRKMSCHDPTYTYLPLAHGNIRLLKLLPDPNELAPVQCRLFDYPLQGACKSSHLYEALSYVWGDQSEAIPIFIGKHRFNVTENLHAALLYLRDCCIERVIWVDAVCINQKNDEEKGEQIQLMASIYSSAQSVVVWLGEEADDSDQALQAIVRAGNNKELNFEDDVIVQQAVTKLLQRQWFRRIWVTITIYVPVLYHPAKGCAGAPGSRSRSTHSICMWKL